MTRRQALTGIVLMVDIRRGLTDLDRQLLAWIPGVLPLVLVLTKADKLSRQQGLEVRRQLLQETIIQQREGPVLLQLFSALNRTGVEPLRDVIACLLESGAQNWAALVAQGNGPYAPMLLKDQGMIQPPT